jgi:hypothetical protein
MPSSTKIKPKILINKLPTTSKKTLLTSLSEKNPQLVEDVQKKDDQKKIIHYRVPRWKRRQKKKPSLEQIREKRRKRRKRYYESHKKLRK